MKAGRKYAPRASNAVCATSGEYVLGLTSLRAQAVLTLLWMGAAPCIADNDMQNHAAATAQISAQCAVTADIRSDEREACWHLLCGSAEPTLLGCDLTAMHQVTSLSVSPDRKRLAVISVGEGHPIIELVDLPRLLKQRKYTSLCTFNPFPGTLNVTGWNKSEALVESDVLLTTDNPERRAASLSDGVMRFRISTNNCTIEPEP